jgi:uncharacterized membrane protein YwzB
LSLSYAVKHLANKKHFAEIDKFIKKNKTKQFGLQPVAVCMNYGAKG